MKKIFTLFLVLLFCFGSGSCVSVQVKKKESVSQTVYAIADSFKVSRVDLAKKYSDESLRLVTPPKVRLKITGIRAANLTSPDKIGEQKFLQKISGTKGPPRPANIKVDVEGKYINSFDTQINPEQNIVVLPPEFKGAPIVIEDSPEYKKILDENTLIRKENDKMRADLEKLQKKDDKILIAQDKILEKDAEKKVIAQHSFWGKVKFWGLIAAGIAGLGVLMWFVPAAIPIISAIFSGLIKIISGFFRAILNLFNKK